MVIKTSSMIENLARDSADEKTSAELATQNAKCGDDANAANERETRWGAKCGISPHGDGGKGAHERGRQVRGNRIAPRKRAHANDIADGYRQDCEVPLLQIAPCGGWKAFGDFARHQNGQQHRADEYGAAKQSELGKGLNEGIVGDHAIGLAKFARADAEKGGVVK